MEVGSPPPPPLPKKSAPPGQLEQPPSRIGTKLSPEPPGSKPEPQDSKCELSPPPAPSRSLSLSSGGESASLGASRPENGTEDPASSYRLLEVGWELLQGSWLRVSHELWPS